ncbi:hypothetical protein THAOC_24975, partial [Thalassiosira oceanica]
GREGGGEGPDRTGRGSREGPSLLISSFDGIDGRSAVGDEKFEPDNTATALRQAAIQQSGRPPAHPPAGPARLHQSRWSRDLTIFRLPMVRGGEVAMSHVDLDEKWLYRKPTTWAVHCTRRRTPEGPWGGATSIICQESPSESAPCRQKAATARRGGPRIVSCGRAGPNPTRNRLKSGFPESSRRALQVAPNRRIQGRRGWELGRPERHAAWLRCPKKTVAARPGGSRKKKTRGVLRRRP